MSFDENDFEYQKERALARERAVEFVLWYLETNIGPNGCLEPYRARKSLRAGQPVWSVEVYLDQGGGEIAQEFIVGVSGDKLQAVAFEEQVPPHLRPARPEIRIIHTALAPDRR